MLSVKMYDGSTVPSIRFLLALMLLSVLSLVSCKTIPTIPQTTSETCTTTILRDTLITVLPDSATLRALFRCDSLNRVVLTENHTLRGRRMALAATATPRPDGAMQVQVDCHEDSLSLQIQLRDQIITRQQHTIQTLRVPQPLTRWQSFFLVLGYATATLLALTILTIATIFIFKLVKRY